MATSGERAIDQGSFGQLQSKMPSGQCAVTM